MLTVKGKVGKSIIAHAIKEFYKNTRIYSYGKDIPMIYDCYHVESSEYSVIQFCQYLYENISDLVEKNEYLPLDIVVVYTNLSDEDDISILEDYANSLEKNGKVNMMIIMSRG